MSAAPVNSSIIASDQEKRDLILEMELLADAKETSLYEEYLKRYKPHAKQQEFHSNNAIIRLFLGGNQSGKSRGGYSEDVAMALGHRPWDGTRTINPPAKVLICGPDFKNHHSEITVPYLNKMIPRSMIASKEKGNQGEVMKYTLTNGSTIKLMSYEQHLKKASGQVSPFEGHMWDYIHFDEPPPYGVFTACHRGIMARGGRMGFTLTPLSCPWIYDKLYAKAGNLFEDGQSSIYAVQVSIHDNPYLHEEQKRSFLDSLDSDMLEAREHGRFMHLIGIVYKGYDPQVHVIKRSEFKIEADWPKGLVIDPHDRKPCAMAWFAMTPDNEMVFFDEWPRQPFQDMKRSPIRTIEGLADMIKQNELGFPGGPGSVVYRIMDPRFGDSQKLGIDASIVDEFARHKLFFMTDIVDSVDRGHLAVNSLLEFDREYPVSAVNKPRLYFTDNCYNLQYGMTHYIWEDWRNEGKGLKETPSQEFKDFPDLIRYAATYKPRFFSINEMRAGQMKRLGSRIGAMANSGLGR